MTHPSNLGETLCRDRSCLFREQALLENLEFPCAQCLRIENVITFEHQWKLGFLTTKQHLSSMNSYKAITVSYWSSPFSLFYLIICILIVLIYFALISS